MWRPMAQALGWPDKTIGWADVAELATSEAGWSDYGHPEWGAFKFGHTHPAYSNSGIVSIIAEAYAGAGKQRGLTESDLEDPQVRDFMTNVEKSIIHYGTSTGFFGDRMFERGPSYSRFNKSVVILRMTLPEWKKTWPRPRSLTRGASLSPRFTHYKSARRS